MRLSTSPQAALDSLALEPADIIVCDLHMPEMDGVTFWERLNEMDPKLAARVVFVSSAEAHSTRGSSVTAKVPLVRKPFQASELEGTVLQLLAS